MSNKATERISPGDQARWFAEKVQPHESGLRAWLRARFPTMLDFDDIVQEAYVRLFRAKEAGRVAAGSVKPYLYSTARNVVIDLYRHKQVIAVEPMTEEGGLAVLDNKPDGAEIASRDDELALLEEAIRALPERCREILVLRRLHGLSQKQIAQKLGIAENTVAAQASIGVRRCMQYFRERRTGR